MTRIEAIIQPWALEEVKRILAHEWVAGMTMAEVKGYGRQRGHGLVYRGGEYGSEMRPKLRVEIVVPTPLVPRLVDDLCRFLRKGEIGDGKLFVYPVDEVIRIRTGERGEGAL